MDVCVPRCCDKMADINWYCSWDSWDIGEDQSVNLGIKRDYLAFLYNGTVLQGSPKNILRATGRKRFVNAT